MEQQGKTPTSPDMLMLEKHIDEIVERQVTARFDRLQASLDHALAQLRASSATTPAERATLFVFSGDVDRLMTAFIIATGAAAMGMQVTMYFSFWALPILKKTTILTGKSVPEKLMALMLPAGPERAGTSKMHMLGIGPAMLKMMLKKHNVETLPGLIALAREMDIRLIACQMTMEVMGITKDELIDDLDYGGVATYLGDACDSRITLFI
jgi:peroxiredoxin family protein